MLDYRDYPELSAAFVAAHPLDDPRFEPWLEAWYGAPVSDAFFLEGPEYSKTAYPERDVAAVFVTRSWLMGAALVHRFGVDQVGQGIWSLLSQFNWPIAPSSGERMIWNAIDVLFREIFEPHAADVLCHLSEKSTTIGDALYMFWDAAGWMPSRSTNVSRRSFLALIEYNLSSSKASVQESALHGVGEYTPWKGEGKGEMPELARLAREFIAIGKTARPELLEYADKAARGMVQ